MLSRLKQTRTINLYQNKFALKVTIIAISIIIGFVSIYYTNLLVEELKEREKRLIELYANTLEYTVNENNNDNLAFIFQEIIVGNNSIPVIVTDENGVPAFDKNIEYPGSSGEAEKKLILARELEVMRQEHDPIVITFKNQLGEVYNHQFVYYRNSNLLNQLTYYPYVQLSVIAVFALLAYLAFSYSKSAEQNRVWVGLAKETAHQLGTPLSSLMAWVEFFKSEPHYKDSGIVEELNKDIKRLDMITSRFSNIGSVPVLKEENIYDAILEIVDYLIPRISTKVKININTKTPGQKAMINKPLFDWVIENLSKNAVDAMSGVGTININISSENHDKVIVDISDTGKGIPKSKLKQVFQPGFTTKKRGWGLGLTLVKRIIENYHKGKIFVKSSEVDNGTTFRIILKNKFAENINRKEKMERTF
ncbi:MAG: ATP-binding protein [Bacteroidota bacterium]|nr:ATP-binding protein [Bacteroidota bacterium]